MTKFNTEQDPAEALKIAVEDYDAGDILGAFRYKLLYAELETQIKKEGLTEKWEEYVGEAEHQDGFAYWNQFEDSKAVWEDFTLYAQIESE